MISEKTQKTFEKLLRLCDNNLIECMNLLEENTLNISEAIADDLWIIFKSKYDNNSGI